MHMGMSSDNSISSLAMHKTFENMLKRNIFMICNEQAKT